MESVIIRGSVRVLSPQIALVFPIVDAVFREEGLTCVLTSLWRPRGAGSFHPMGFAADFDAPVNLDDGRWKRIRDEVGHRLGSEFQVLAHAVEGGKMHLHVEFDPRQTSLAVTT